MSISFFLDGSLLPFESVRLTGGPGGVKGLPSRAWYGEPALASVQIDDEDGALDLAGWHEFWVDESACSKPRIFTGWLFDAEIHRGTYIVGASRVWDCTIIDQNAAFSFEVFRASSAKRPEENDLERATFALASAPMAGTPIHANSRANLTDNAVNFGDADYVTQYPAELFLSIAGTAGKNFYAYWDEAAQQISLHYDLVGANPAAGVSISNVESDLDEPTESATTAFAPRRDGRLNRSPEKQYTGILFGYRGGQYVYGRRQATIDAIGPSSFSPDGFRRDLVYRTDRVGRIATANALLASMLEAHAEQQDTLTFSVQLPASKVNLLKAGDAVDVRFSHLPGYETATTIQVIATDVVPTPFQTDLYDVHVEASNGRETRGPGGGPGTTVPPRPVGCDPDDIVLLDSADVNLSVTTHQFTIPTPTEGSLVVLEVGQRVLNSAQEALVDDFEQATTGPVETADQDFCYRKWWRIVPAGWDGVVQFSIDGVNDPIRVLWSTWSGAGTFHSVGIDDTTANNPATITCGSVTPPAGSTVLIVGGSVAGLNVTDPFDGAALGDSVKLLGIDGGSRVPMWSGYQIVGDASGSYSVDYDPTFTGILAGTIGAVAAFVCDPADPDTPCLAPGQPSPEDEAVTPAPDGVETTFSTRCPFADETLHVYVDNTDQTGALTDYDGGAGTFTLGFAPTATERITVFYLGR